HRAARGAESSGKHELPDVPRWDRFVTVVEDPEAFVVETTAMTRERVAGFSTMGPRARRRFSGTPMSYQQVRRRRNQSGKARFPRRSAPPECTNSIHP